MTPSNPTNERFDIYLANGLFSEADRAFNVRLANALRSRGLTVFLPQETPQNHGAAPTAEGIFLSDARAVLRSRILFAVIDGEVIDSGVACEIGIAVAAGIPIVALWTDIRRKRTGEGRMYHNIFVTGGIEQNGRIFDSYQLMKQSLFANIRFTKCCRMSVKPRSYSIIRDLMISSAPP
jgi:nucleoside 2-deoxyribosyltransferase